MATVYSDVFGSVTRRRLQDEKDERVKAQPVRLYPNKNPGGPFLKLHSVEERLAAREPDPTPRVGRGERRRAKTDRFLAAPFAAWARARDAGPAR